MQSVLKSIVEKLLPARWWGKKPTINEEQWWQAMAAPVNPQTQAVLHEATNKYVGYMQSAAGPGPVEERLRNLDRAMAIADYLGTIEQAMEDAPAEVKRREGARQEKAKG